MFTFWVNNKYIVVYAKDYEAAKIKAKRKHEKLYK
jgi:hypothetical protein